MARPNAVAPSRSVAGRWVGLVTVVALLAVPLHAAARSPSADELRRELEAAEDEAGRLEGRLGDVRGRIAAAEEELAQIGVRLEEARARLTAAEGQVILAEEALVEAEAVQEAAIEDHLRAEDLLERTETELAGEEEVLADQLVASFKYGTVGATRGAMALEVLRRAEDPNAFSVAMKQLKVVVDTQEATVQRVFALREERAELLDAAARARARAVQAANDAAMTLQVVEGLREQAAQLAAQVAAEEARQAELIAQLRADEADTRASLQRVEARERELRRDYERQRALERAAASGGAGGGPPIGDGHCPVPGAVAGRNFINDWGFPRSGGRVHQGNDIFAAKGTPVVAIQSGTVIRINPPSRPTRLGGVTVTYRTAEGSEWYNAHLDTIASGITVGASVAAGQTIGTVGNTGNAATTPPHLHLGRKYGGSWVNPWPAVSQLC